MTRDEVIGFFVCIGITFKGSVCEESREDDRDKSK
jgi:hypothetical protein